MSTPQPRQASAPVNVLLMLVDNLPHRHREVLADIAKCEKKIAELRAEVSRLEKHAAIEGIALNHEPDEPSGPALVPSE